MLQTAEAAQPLREWTDALVASRLPRVPSTLVPYFDPAEAGTGARVLVVMEAPGPMTNSGNRRPGSGFVSVDNDDQTAKNCWTLRDEVGLDETRALHWNIVPWYLGPASKKPTARDLAEGAAALRSLMRILRDLRVVMVAGRMAQTGWAKHVAPDLPSSDLLVIESWHPSPLCLNSHPERREQLRADFALAEVLTRP